MFNYRNSFTRFIIICISISYIAAVMTYHFENRVNPNLDSFIDMIFWWVAVMTTVGAGLSFPITDMGKVFGIITMIFGTLMYFGLFSEMIIWVKNRSDSKYKGIERYNGKGHVIIIGYNSLAVGLIHLLDRVLRSEVDIVLVTDKIDTNPFADRVVFIKSHPASTVTMDRSNAANAKLAIILSNDEVAAERADLDTFLVAGMIEDAQHNVFTMVEISNRDNESELELFHIDADLTADDILTDIRRKDSNFRLILKTKEELRVSLYKEIYLAS